MTERIAGVTAEIARAIRAVLGAPDYERYVTHLRECHPDVEPMTSDEFMRERMESRYNKPGSRCC